jgi:hypothetical protein
MMRSLVRLYPGRWRDRYGDEFEALLAAQRPSIGVILDVFLGAVDAHLTANSPGCRSRWLRRFPGLLVSCGALVWLIAVWVNFAHPSLEEISLQVTVFSLTVVAVGAFMEPSFRLGPRWPRLSNAVPAASLLAMATVAQVTLVWASLFRSFGAQVSSFAQVVLVAGLVAQLVWAALVAKCSTHRLAPLGLAIVVLLNLTVGHVVWSGPGYPPVQDRVLGMLVAVAWMVIGLSTLRLTSSRPTTVAPAPEMDRAPLGS